MQLSGRTFSRPFCRFSFSAKSQQLPESSFSIDSIKELHGHLIRTQKHKDPDSIFLVLRSYSFNPSTLQKAHIVFDEIQRPTPSIWYYMIRGLSKSDDPIQAINMYNNMRTYGINGNNLTLLFVIKACGRVSDVLQGKKVHVHVLKLGFGSNLYVSNALIHMYGTCREMGVAHKVFDEMSERDLVSWNSLICGYSLSNRYREVLGVFDAMQAAKVRADAVTMVKVIMACSVMQEWSVFLRFTQNNGSVFLQALQQWHSKEKRTVTRKKTLLFKK